MAVMKEDHVDGFCFLIWREPRGLARQPQESLPHWSLS